MISFLFLDSSKMSNVSTKEFFKSVFFENWLLAKGNACRIFLIAWIFARLWYVGLFYAMDLGIYFPSEYIEVMVANATTNTSTLKKVDVNTIDWCRGNIITSHTIQKIIIVLILLQSRHQLMYDLIEFTHAICNYNRAWHFWTEKGRKKVVVQMAFYRLMQFLSVAGMSFMTTNTICHSFTRNQYLMPKWILDITYIQISMGMTWSLLYFVQMNPWMGKMVVSVQCMVHDLFRFFIVYSLALIMFAHAFLRLISDGTNQTRNCSEEFATVLDSWYR